MVIAVSISLIFFYIFSMIYFIKLVKNEEMNSEFDIAKIFSLIVSPIDTIDIKIQNGIMEKIKALFIKSFNNISFQVIVFGFIIFIIRPFISHNIFVTILSLAYLGFFIYFLIISLPVIIAELFKFIEFKKNNSFFEAIEEYIKDKVLEESKNHSKFEQVAVNLRVDNAVSEIIEIIFFKILTFGLLVSAYIVIFRFIVLPYLVDNYIGWNLIQLGLYPIFMIFDNFLGLHLTEWLVG